MKYKSAGFAIYIIPLILTVFVAAGFIYLRLNNHAKVTKSNQAAASQPTSFSDCLSRGGSLLSVPGPGGNDPDDTLNNVSIRANTLVCDYQTKPYYANNDAQCHNQQACDEITLAAKPICSSKYGVSANTMDPTFKFLPVIHGDYAKMVLTDCSNSHYKILPAAARAQTAVMKKSESNWEILAEVNSESSCSGLDKKGIPAELEIYCIDSSGRSRILNY